ncbi:hypothetical protein D6D08_02221 [Aureobasidium pullulans]|nr:hypothetical protein D6D08_02221 [Aureobasidium pullulans]
MIHDNFHPFPRLPLELREEIWRLCLPYRVSEREDPNDCRSNKRPPLLARVCRESRRVASATGKWMPFLVWRNDVCSSEIPCEADWKTGKVIDHGNWQDTSRDSAHMNWTPSYDVDFGPQIDGHPLTTIAQEAKLLNGHALQQQLLLSMQREYRPDPNSIDEADAVDAEGNVREKGKKGILDELSELWDEKQYEEEFNLDGFLSTMKA